MRMPSCAQRLGWWGRHAVGIRLCWTRHGGVHGELPAGRRRPMVRRDGGQRPALAREHVVQHGPRRCGLGHGGERCGVPAGAGGAGGHGANCRCHRSRDLGWSPLMLWLEFRIRRTSWQGAAWAKGMLVGRWVLQLQRRHRRAVQMCMLRRCDLRHGGAAEPSLGLRRRQGLAGVGDSRRLASAEGQGHVAGTGLLQAPEDVDEALLRQGRERGEDRFVEQAGGRRRGSLGALRSVDLWREALRNGPLRAAA
mmetsp:Transcript_66771/g.169264  ORF Transcript_66771/g.169264 Transcript_66771/m.169264 type:complete len:252 (+) Transcript_66771:801-1556(+)